MSMSSQAALSAVETTRASLIAMVNQACDELAATFSPVSSGEATVYKMPTLADGHDPLNKNGLNLTKRGIEILYRVFDDGGGYNRAAKMLNITQGAAKNRKALWLKEGGTGRKKEFLDIDKAR